MPETVYCNQPHPAYIEQRETTTALGATALIDTPTVWCRRLKNHTGNHSAYTFGIHEPEIWPNDEQEPPF